MRQPCELMTRAYVPAIRASIAKILMEKYNYTQTSAAKKLGLTQSAMSRYLREQRGENVTFTPEIRSLGESIAKGIHEDALTHNELQQKICQTCYAYQKEMLCQCHIP